MTITESRMDQYNRAYYRAATANPMTADCPPQDEADSIRDSFVEEVTEDKIREAVSDPDLMAEMVLENDYDQEGFKEMAIALSVMMDNRNSLDARMDFSSKMEDFIDMKAKSLAEDEVDG